MDDLRTMSPENLEKMIAERKERMFQKTGERECEICGKWFRPHRADQKYCPACGKKSDVAKSRMKEDLRNSIRAHGTGAQPKLFKLVCKECGKEFLYPKENGRNFCSGACRMAYAQKHTFCPYCKKQITDSTILTAEFAPYCSKECQKKQQWDIAKKNGLIQICPQCGKEFLKNSKFCSKECYLAYVQAHKKVPDQPSYTCARCGKVFQSLHAKVFCSDECRKLSMEAVKAKQPTTEWEKMRIENLQAAAEKSKKTKALEVREKAKREAAKREKEKRRKAKIERLQAAEKERQKQDAATKQEKYIKENGLCSICKTNYLDCERMQTGFRMSPEGAVFSGSVVIKCPKFRK